MTPRAPYQGLAPFTESDDDAQRFFGRDEEVRIIAANLVASRLTILYGPSGVGKSSLLRAGAIHRLRRTVPGAARIAVAYVGTWGEDPAEAVLSAVEEEAARLAGGPAPDPPASDLPLDEALAAWQGLLGLRLLLILDQFEEYCLYHPPDTHAFDHQLPLAIERRDLALRFMIGVREDSLAVLDRYKGRVSALFSNRIRLENLSREAALAAITGPVERYNEAAEEPVVIEAGLAEAVLGDIAPGQVALATQGRGTAGGRSSGAGAGGVVETPYLQLVMQTLWEREREAGSRVLRLETLRAMGGATQVVRGHVDSVVNRLTRPQQDLAARALHFLVTPSGTKVAHTASDLADYADAEPQAVGGVLERLCEGDARLLRRVAPVAGRDEPPYEVFPDVLAPALLDWRARLQSRRGQRRLTTLLALVVSLIVALAATLAYAVGPPWADDAEGATVDARASIGGPPLRAEDVTIVDFDRVSVDRLGGTVPLDRRVHARMIDALRRAGAEVIAYDIQFHSAKQRRVDRALQEAVRRAAGRVVLSSFQFGDDDRLTQFGNTRSGRTDRLLASLGARLGYSGLPTSGDAKDPTYSAIEPSVRFAPGSPVVPALATAAGQAADVDTSTGEDSVALAFRGGAGSFRTVRAIDVLSGRAPADALRGNVVLVGMSDPRGGDGRRLTPVGRMPGVEVHANAYAALVRGRHPARDILVIALIALIPALVARARPVVATAAILAAAAAYAIAAQVLFAAGWILPVALPLAGLALSSAGLVAIRIGLARTASDRRRAPGPTTGAAPPSPTAAGDPLVVAGAGG